MQNELEDIKRRQTEPKLQPVQFKTIRVSSYDFLFGLSVDGQVYVCTLPRD